MSAKKEIGREELSGYLHLPEKAVAKKLGICLTSLKKVCRLHGITRWPYRKLKSLDKRIHKIEASLAAGEGGADEQANLRERLDALHAERKALPFRPSGSAYNPAEDDSDGGEEAGGGSGGEQDLMDTPRTDHNASPTAMNSGDSVSTEPGEGMDVDFQKGTPAKAANGKKSNGKTPSSSAKANGSSKKKDDVKAKILACAETGGDIFVIPMPHLAQRACMGSDDSTPIKLELTLPVAVAEEVSAGRISFKIVQEPGKDPTLHLYAAPKSTATSNGAGAAAAKTIGGGLQNGVQGALELPTVGETQESHEYDSLFSLVDDHDGDHHGHPHASPTSKGAKVKAPGSNGTHHEGKVKEELPSERRGLTLDCTGLANDNRHPRTNGSSPRLLAPSSGNYEDLLHHDNHHELIGLFDSSGAGESSDALKIGTMPDSVGQNGLLGAIHDDHDIIAGLSESR